MAGSCMIGIFIILLLTISSSDGLGIDSISVDENTPTYISVSWSTDAGSSWNHYMVDIVAPSGQSLTGYPINTTDTSYQITGLRPEVEYTITVIPWSGSGAGDALNITVTTEAIAEGEILVSDVTSSSAHIQWRAVEGVLFYKIVTEPSDAIGFLGGIFEEEVGLTILLPGTVFNLTVQNGQSFLNLASTQIRSAPESPVNVTLDQIGSTEATISWTPPTTPRDAYEVYVIKNSTNERLLAATIRPEDVNECTVNGLSRGWVYRFEVGTLLDASNSFALQRSDMNSNPSVLGRTEDISDGEILVSDGEILVSNVTTSSAFIQWKPRDGISSYTIVAEPRSAIEPLADLADSSTKLTLLLPGTVFTVTVRGGNPVTDLVSTQIRSGPEAPLGVFVSSVTSVSVSLTLTPLSSPHDGYELYKLDTTDNHRALVSNLTLENYGIIYETDIVGLVPATLYNVEVVTFLNAEGSFPLQRSEENETVTFITGNAGVQSPESTMLLISLLAFLATVLLI